MRKINIIIILFLLVALALIFYRNFPKDVPASQTATVIINDEGFSPDKIIVVKGTIVTWISQGEHLHWPASNFHPTHTLYPEPGGCLGSKFDTCRGLKTGESFSFQMDKIGTWPMHDHLFPGLNMIVEVTPLPNLPLRKGEEKARLPDGQGGSLSSTEFRQLDYGQQLEFIKSMATDDPAQAWAYVKNSFIVNGQVVGNAHEFAHIVGHQAFEKFGLDGVKICDETFAFGCFHGVTEKMLLKNGLKNIKAIEEGCLRVFPPDKSQNYTGCIHGTGHGVYGFEGGNLKKSLADCDVISQPYRQYCYDGVFMENSSAPASRIFDEKNPWKLCANLDERYHRNCARYQSQIFLGKFGSPNSLNLVGQNCALGPSTLLRETCFESLGYYVAQNALGVPAEILKKCGQMSDKEGKEICTSGAATESVFQKYSGFADSAIKLCKTLTEPRQLACLNNINRMLKSN